MMRSSLAFVLLTMTLAACGGDSDPAADAATGSNVDSGPGTIDAAPGTSDARIVADAGPAATNCVHEYVSSGPMCNDDCDARLTTPDDGRWCTTQCASDANCTPYSATLTCAAEVGTCMPRCTTNAECTAIGLARCHPLGNFCDTLPACSTDAQCMGVGYDTCVMPGNYCQ